MLTKEQVERYIRAADSELGQCEEAWVEECRVALRQFVPSGGCVVLSGGGSSAVGGYPCGPGGKGGGSSNGDCHGVGGFVPWSFRAG